MRSRDMTEDEGPTPPTVSRWRRFEERALPYLNLGLGVATLIAALVVIPAQFDGVKLAAEQADRAKPQIHFGEYYTDQALLRTTAAIFLTNSGGSPITVASVELLSLPVVYPDLVHANSGCEKDAMGNITGCKPDLRVAVLDYVAATVGPKDIPLTMSTPDSCTPSPTTIEPGSRPVAFAFTTKEISIPGGTVAIPTPYLVSPKLQRFRIRINYFDRPSTEYWVTPPGADGISPQASALVTNFNKILESCAPKMGDRIDIPAGSKYQQWTLSESGMIPGPQFTY